MIIVREKIRPAIKEMDTVADLQALINACFAAHTEEEDAEFIRECASEIYWRGKENE